MDILIVGIGGRMGQILYRRAVSSPLGVRVVGGVDVCAPALAVRDGFPPPIYTCVREFEGRADAVIDFSSPENSIEVSEYCAGRGIPLVLAATGQSAAVMRRVRAAGRKIPLLLTPNLSVGATLLCRLCSFVGQTDAFPESEIVEAHRCGKRDAPSGTARMLARVLCREGGRKARVGTRRGRGDLPIHSIRLGEGGESHTVLFAREGESLTLTHTVRTPQVYADGALEAAHFLMGAPAGIYSMTDILKKELI